MSDQLIFYGHSPDVFQTINHLVHKIELGKNLEQKHISDKDFIFFNDELFSSTRSIIIIEQDFLSNKLLRKIHALRRSTWSPQITVCVVLAQATSHKQQRHFTRFGVNIIAANDGDLEATFWQLMHLAYDGQVSLPEFAKTKNFFAKTKLKVPTYIEKINSLECYISCDMELPTNEGMILSLDGEFPIFLKNGKKIASPSVESYAQHYYSYSIGTDNSWGSDTTSNLTSWDTVETQLNFSYKLTSRESRKVLLIDSAENYASLLKTYRASPLDIDIFHCEADTKRFKNLIKQFWDVILIGSTPYLTEEKRMDLIIDIADRCNSNDEDSLIFISDSPSKPEALRKLLRYEKVLASGEPLSCELFGLLLPALEKNKESGIETYITKESGFGGATVVERDCIITSISEFIITFAVTELLPAKTVVELDIGIPLSLVIAPPFRNFPKIGDKYQYGAFIFDLCESDLEILRRAVNYYLHKEVTEINPDFLKVVIESMNDEKKNDQDAPKEVSKNPKSSPEKKIEVVKGYYTKL